jgi:hypothetical protein
LSIEEASITPSIDCQIDEIIFPIIFSYGYCLSLFTMTANVLPLAAGGDLEALHCQPAPKLNRSTNF